MGCPEAVEHPFGNEMRLKDFRPKECGAIASRITPRLVTFAGPTLLPFPFLSVLHTWLCFEFSSDLPGLTTPDQFVGPLMLLPDSAGRPLVARGGDVEVKWVGRILPPPPPSTHPIQWKYSPAYET